MCILRIHAAKVICGLSFSGAVHWRLMVDIQMNVVTCSMVLTAETGCCTKKGKNRRAFISEVLQATDYKSGTASILLRPLIDCVSIASPLHSEAKPKFAEYRDIIIAMRSKVSA
jgi:hypothetical protein